MDALAALSDIRAALGGLLPEAVLTGGLVAVLLLGQVRRVARWVPWLTAAVLVGAAAALAAQPDRAAFFQQMLLTDGPARAGGVLAALAGLLSLALLPRTDHDADPKFLISHSAFLIPLTLGAFLLARVVHGIGLVLAVELISIPSYALVLVRAGGGEKGRRDDKAAARAALNYVLLGAVATGALLYGLSLLYGLTGSLHFATEAFWRHLAEAPMAPVLLALGLVLAGLLFKLGAAPLHFWAPDAYQAAPLPVALLLSTAPKLATVVVLWRFHEAATALLPAAAAGAVGNLFTGAALLSLVVGTLGGLGQTDVRRLLAYSSIAQAGFLLLAIRAGGAAGPAPVLLYAGFLLLANGATFAAISFFENRKQQYATVGAGLAPGAPGRAESYSGLGRRFPLPAVALTLGMVALTGLPPTVGFPAKLLAFTALWQADASVLGRALLGAGLAATVASLFFYLRVPYWLWLRPPTDVAATSGNVSGRRAALLAAVLAALTVAAFVKSEWLLAMLDR